MKKITWCKIGIIASISALLINAFLLPNNNVTSQYNLIRGAYIPLISCGVILMCIYWWAND